MRSRQSPPDPSAGHQGALDCLLPPSVSLTMWRLRPFDPLGRIKAARAAAFRRFDALAVDDAGRRNGAAANQLAFDLDERMVDPRPRYVVTPAIELTLHG